MKSPGGLGEEELSLLGTGGWGKWEHLGGWECATGTVGGKEVPPTVAFQIFKVKRVFDTEERTHPV